MCLASTVVASWSLTQEVSGLNSLMKNIFEVVLANSVKTFREKSNEKKETWKVVSRFQTLQIEEVKREPSRNKTLYLKSPPH